MGLSCPGAPLLLLPLPPSLPSSAARRDIRARTLGQETSPDTAKKEPEPRESREIVDTAFHLMITRPARSSCPAPRPPSSVPYPILGGEEGREERTARPERGRFFLLLLVPVLGTVGAALSSVRSPATPRIADERMADVGIPRVHEISSSGVFTRIPRRESLENATTTTDATINNE